MKNYRNITDIVHERYRPVKAFVVFTASAYSPPYVECYDMDKDGRPVNAHPLTLNEASKLGKALSKANHGELLNYLTPGELMPENILHIDHSRRCVIWHTLPQRKMLRFTENIGLPDGQVNVPGMVWKATKSGLRVWAVGSKRKSRPKIEEPLFKAPFFNVYADGLVCMGTVGSYGNRNGSLENFIGYWEEAFWNSSFSHMNTQASPVKGNIIQLWEGLIGTQRPFPSDSLLPFGKTISKII